MRYKLSGTEYSLYSIGPDGIDGGGRPVEDTKHPEGAWKRFFVYLDSKGDFVAGINN